MFFIGVSAHLFVYLLIPAFLIVCFYCRGIQGSPEVQAPLPVIVVYEQTRTCHSADTYFYRSDSEKKVRTGIKLLTFTNIPSRLAEPFFTVRPYVGCVISLNILRAPPFFRIPAGN